MRGEAGKGWPDLWAMFMRSFFKCTTQMSSKCEMSPFRRGSQSFPWGILLVLGGFVLFSFLSEFAEILTYLGESVLLESYSISTAGIEPGNLHIKNKARGVCLRLRS